MYLDIHYVSMDIEPRDVSKMILLGCWNPQLTNQSIGWCKTWRKYILDSFSGQKYHKLPKEVKSYLGTVWVIHDDSISKPKQYAILNRV